jgi:hypothetical protein
MCSPTERTSSQVTLRDISESPFSFGSGSSSPLAPASERAPSSAYSKYEVSSTYSSPAGEELDLKSAAQKIAGILCRKVYNAKKVEKLRQSALAERIKRAPEKTSFIVEKIPISEYPVIRRIITSWLDEIERLISQEGITKPDRIRLSNSQGIIWMIESELLSGDEEHSRSREKPNPTFFLVAKNPHTETIEAIACVIQPHKPVGRLFKADYEINYLATAPKNLRLSFQSTCLSGAATALIENIAYRTLRHTAQKRISLYSSPCAVDFYRKLGFSTPKGDCKFNLSGDNLVEFLSRFGGISLGSSL